MAGGLGLRLRPLTTEIPKPMMPILGKPYLEYQLRYLKNQGFNRVLILTGYLSQVIRDYFGDGRSFDVQIQYSEEKKPLGTGGGLRLAAKLLEEKFMIIYGDSFLPIDLRKVVVDFERSHVTGMLVAYDNKGEDTTVRNNVGLNSDGWITCYQKNPVDLSLDHVEAGVSVFNKNVLTYLPDQQVISLEEQVFPKLIQDGQLRGWSTSQRFYDIGKPERLKTIETFFCQNPELFV